MADSIEKIIEIHVKYKDLVAESAKVQEAIYGVREELKKLESADKRSNTEIAEKKLQLSELNKVWAQYRKQIGDNIKAQKSLEGSLDALNQELARLTRQYNAMAGAERNAARGDELAKKITDIKKEVNAANEKIFDFSENVGNYRGLANGFTPLNFQVQQLARELPSLTHSTTQFFLAISNNLPMLIDEMSKLKAQGVGNKQIFKELVSSVFSWQTALVVGITLITAYGDKIVAWAKEIGDATDANKEFEKAIRSANLGVGKDIALIKSLSSEWNALGDNMKAKEKFIKDNQQKFEDLGVSISNVNEAENLLVNNTDSYIAALRMRAEGAIAVELASKKYEAAIKKQIEVEDKIKKGYVTRIDPTTGSLMRVSITEAGKREMMRDVDALNAEADRYLQIAEERRKAYASRLDSSGINPAGGVTSAATSSTLLSRLRSQTEKLQEETFRITMKFIEKQEDAELEVNDRKRDHELSAIQEQIDAISALKIGGVYKDGEEEVTITEEIYAELLTQREALEEKKTATAEAYSRERAEIEKKYAEKAQREAEKQSRESIRRYREAQRQRERSYRNNRTIREAGVRGYRAQNPGDEVGAAQLELELAQQAALNAQQELDELMRQSWGNSEDAVQQWMDAVTAANAEVARSNAELEESERRLSDAESQRFQDSLDGFSQLAGSLGSVASAMNENAGIARGLSIAQGALAMISAVEKAANVGWPANMIAIASVISQFAAILSQIRSLNDESRNTFAQGGLIPIGDSAGIIKGPSHANGGVALSLGGQKVAEVEGDELLAIVNKKDTARLNALSSLNSLHGRKFADGGVIDFSGVYGSMNLSSGHSIDTSGIDAYAGVYGIIAGAIRYGMAGSRFQVAVRDINTAQANVKVRDSYSKFRRRSNA